ncbi:cysteine desulfurase family protein [Flavilitoribacter nigricans]|uniref:Cysteine desulfurase n=1 Tax=Flavilitoribacter nigricans (strain ATCC 23147 / DSM 23189 / NBRC 102662 / NCIMB 1420 / SS-2) TaxID=1122177 RepID=A0A2D0NJ20_FLAN2|nr:cysteine desulfurase family protein [Flavilitoribacter nigricans]PHN08492.1 cysteine desulfurase [Flavilitoribacter nigricans DSM 23189 = NBRC 102662]
MRVYFDNAATTPILDEVIDAMSRSMRENFGNPSSIHREGRTARAAVEQARKVVAQSLGASIGEIFFTSCGTESNNMVLKNAVRDLGVTRIISSPIEHHCVLHTVDRIGKETPVKLEQVKLDESGHVDLDHLRTLLSTEHPGKTLVSLMHSNNEIGTMIDLEEIGELCAEYGAYFHSDTVQTVGYFPIDLSRLKVNFISGSAHKFHGPKGVGFVYINNDNILEPYLDGGAQERNMRGGTENIYGIVGLAKALELAVSEMDQRRAYITGIRDYFREQLLAQFPDITFNGDPDGRAHYKVLSVDFPPSEKASLILFNLDIAGISVSGGSACSSGIDTGSHVISALKPDSDRHTVRFSFSHLNTREEVDQVISKLKEILPA